MCDLYGRTRSWLMVTPVTTYGGPGTRLYFGSAVIPVKSAKTGGLTLGPGFRALIGFHRMYSKALLHAARSPLNAQRTQ